MAKITVYLPDDLARRVKDHRAHMNVSQIARAAIARALADLSAKEKPTMSIQATIDRFTAEKMENPREAWEVESEQLGRMWAMRVATLEQLKRVPETNDGLFDFSYPDQMYGIWHTTVFRVNDAQHARDFWNEQALEMQHRGFPVDAVSLEDFTCGACAVRDELMEEKPGLF